jgi:integrase
MKPRNPSYRLHKPSGQAVVTFQSQDTYLGKYNSPESKVEYDRLLAEWLACGRCLPAKSKRRDVSIAELILAFWKHAKEHYRREDGTPTTELDNFRLSLRPLRQLYGQTKAIHFGPLALKTVREKMIESGCTRGVINQRIGRIKRMFRWATENEVVELSIYQGLMAVRGLEKGRSKAKETEAVKPVNPAHVDAVLPHLLPPVAAMVQLQLLTGMRPGEVTKMRGTTLDLTGPVWFYNVTEHKNAWRGYSRHVLIGPKAQQILAPFLRSKGAGYLLSPSDAMDHLRQEQRKNRQSKIQPSQINRKKSRPKKQPGIRYTTKSYRHAIAKACKKAKIPHWHPHQLRHTRATEIRAEFGLDVARIILGHRSPKITEVYAEIDASKGIEVMKNIG